MRRLTCNLVAAAAALALTGAASAGSIVVQSTTSTANSGLYDHLGPQIEAATGVKINVVAVGTGQAIRNAANCDGDLLLVHAKAAEEAFVASGFGEPRADLMYNDFVFVGPADDPAGVAGGSDAIAALQAIAGQRRRFASRGDDSGTHKKELSLWAAANLDPAGSRSAWYLQLGSGMGATLNTSVGLGAYTMTDRATWISFKNKSDFQIAVEGDPALFNQYGVIVVNPDACPDVDAAAARRVAGWLLSAEGQAAIAAYEVDGQQLFFPNAP